jgi:uncharacterized protein YbaP (TraB family)
MNKKNLLLILCVSFIQTLVAQKLPSTLLWKITGNGLQKPSYLYGTMHLTDERIFNVGDSVYKAIENTEGFAMEIDPEQFTPLVIDETKKSIAKTMRLKDAMKPEEYKKYAKVLAKRLDKNEDDITTSDILHAKNKWVEESYRKGKMQTFLDVYLFDIARRQGKWTGGVEDLQDQQNVLDYIDESDIQELVLDDDDKEPAKEKKLSSFFIKTYINNDLNTLDSLSYSGDSAFTNVLLIKRNKKMAMRMDSLGHERSMMFAVGAAHLPGDEGLIALLKEKGFTVEPVFSSKKIKPADYKVADIPLPWYDVSDANGYYSASMPGKAGDLTMYAILNMKMYFDVFSSTVYMTTALQTPYSESMADSIFDRMVMYYFKADDYSKGKPIVINNIPGREFSSMKDNYSHGYLLFKDGVMYIALAMCMKKDTSAAGSINRFLHSFKINESAVNSHTNSFTYTNATKAYQVNVPAKPSSANEILSARQDTTMVSDLNMSIDPATGAYFFFGVNETAKGFFIKNDSSTFVNIRESQKEKFAQLTTDTVYMKNGHRVMELGGIMKQASITLKAYYEFRGNRWYALVAMYDSAKAYMIAQQFFNSFKTLNYGSPEWSNYTPADKLFSAWAPMNFTYPENTSSENDSSYNYEAYDSLRADNYLVVVQNFGKYYWQNSDSALWKDVLDVYNDTSDSLLYKKAINNGDAKGYELALQGNGSNNIKRVRKLLNGGKLYSLVTIQAASEINNANTDKFFEIFRFNNMQPNDGLFASKAAALLTDITSEDSVVRDKAIAYLDKASFTKAELPLLHAAVLKSYASDEEDYDYVKNTLKKIIIGLEDTSSLEFARNSYANADDTTKNVLLSIMASFPTQQNFDEVKTILLKLPPRITPAYDFTGYFLDTLQLTSGIFPSLLPLIKDTVMAPIIITLANHLLDSNYIDKNLLQPYQEDILQIAQKKYAIAKADADSYDDGNYNLMELLGKMNNNESNVMLQQWSILKHIYLQQQAVEILLRNNQT